MKNVVHIRNSIYEKRARNPSSWFSAGFMNEEIGRVLLNRYKRYYSDLGQAMSESVLGNFPKKKWKLNHIDGDLHRYILMFFGYAVENYLKGILVKKGLDPVDKNKSGIPCLKNSITNHNLVSYFKDVFGNPSILEKETLEKLQSAVRFGKYPLPKSSKEYYSYTANLDNTVFVTGRLISSMKQLAGI